jgi:hypothetical protein
MSSELRLSRDWREPDHPAVWRAIVRHSNRKRALCFRANQPLGLGCRNFHSWHSDIPPTIAL